MVFDEAFDVIVIAVATLAARLRQRLAAWVHKRHR